MGKKVSEKFSTTGSLGVLKTSWNKIFSKMKCNVAYSSAQLYANGYVVSYLDMLYIKSLVPTAPGNLTSSLWNASLKKIFSNSFSIYTDLYTATFPVEEGKWGFQLKFFIRSIRNPRWFLSGVKLLHLILNIL